VIAWGVVERLRPDQKGAICLKMSKPVSSRPLHAEIGHRYQLTFTEEGLSALLRVLSYAAERAGQDRDAPPQVAADSAALFHRLKDNVPTDYLLSVKWIRPNVPMHDTIFCDSWCSGQSCSCRCHRAEHR
jgi:hypothetical protein